MKNFLKTVFVIIIILLLGAGAYYYFVLRDETEVPPFINPSTSGDAHNDLRAEKVMVTDVPVKNGTDNIRVDCVYPRISSFEDKEFENYINKEIATNINDYRNEINYIVDEETTPTELYTYFCSYERYDNGDYLSLVISQNYQTGGIRSNEWKDIYNINAKTERLFYLEDIFKPGIDFEKAIISEITKQASANNIELMGGNGLKKLSIKQKFYIQNDKLIIYFDPSEAAAAVYGELNFEMPFTLNSEGFFEI